MDEVARYNQERWKALDEVEAVFTRPSLDLDVESAASWVNSDGRLGDLDGKKVLLLAGGGGQQSAAFGLLGAEVTVFDLSPAQLQKDRLVAERYGLAIETIQGDMRDLSALGEAQFDIVYHPHSLDFVPDANAVFAQVAGVLKPGGIYYFDCVNPFHASLSEASWNGDGYVIERPYRAGDTIEVPDSEWTYDRRRHPNTAVPPTRSYTRSFAEMMNSLAELGFALFHVDDRHAVHPDTTPGTWGHLAMYAPPWIAFWLRYGPDA